MNDTIELISLYENERLETELSPFGKTHQNIFFQSRRRCIFMPLRHKVSAKAKVNIQLLVY